MKKLRIDGKMAQVFVLSETDKRLVFVNLQSLSAVDYERFLKMEEKVSPERNLLAVMRDERLSNGRKALVQYNGLIDIGDLVKDDPKNDLIRIRKPTDPEKKSAETSVVVVEKPKGRAGRKSNAQKAEEAATAAETEQKLKDAGITLDA